MKKEAIKDAIIRTAGLTIGTAGSRVLADKVPIENVHIKRGVLVLAGFLGASLLDRSTGGKAFVQDLALGTAVTQTGAWIKDAIADKMQDNEIVTTALGTPLGDYNNPVQFRMGYADFRMPETIEADPVDVSGVTFEI